MLWFAITFAFPDVVIELAAFTLWDALRLDGGRYLPPLFWLLRTDWDWFIAATSNRVELFRCRLSCGRLNFLGIFWASNWFVDIGSSKLLLLIMVCPLTAWLLTKSGLWITAMEFAWAFVAFYEVLKVDFALRLSYPWFIMILACNVSIDP